MVFDEDEYFYKTHPIRFQNSLTEYLILAYASSSKPKYTDLEQKQKKRLVTKSQHTTPVDKRALYILRVQL